MTVPACESCRQIFAEHEDNKKLADILEAEHPRCGCEQYRVGQGSPGPVANDETLLRIIISPRDVDFATGTIAARPFEKAFSNGVSVCREIATNEHLLSLVREGLNGDAPRSVITVCRARAGNIRSVLDEACERVFCIYDQTVTRDNPSLDPMPTHAGIFGRRPLIKTTDRRRTQKDFAGRLRELFIEGQTAVTHFREGILATVRRAET